MVLVNIAVGQNQYVGTVAVGAVDIHKQAVDGLLQIGIFVVADGERLDLEAGHVHGFDLQKVGIGQDGVLDFKHLAVLGILLQQVALGTDIDGGGGDDLLAQGVDGRVGNLSEHLLEVLKQQGMGVAQHGQRGVAAHGTGRLTAVFGHRQDDRGHILVPIAEGLLQLHQFLFGMVRHLLVGNLQIAQVDQVAVQPLAVGLTAGVVGFQLIVVHQFALNGIHQQHLAGAQAVLADNILGRDVQHAYLTGKDQTAVFGNIVAAGAQTVAVQHRAHHIAIAEQDAGGAVPRLQHCGIILVEVPLFRVHGLVIAPRLGDSYHYGQGQVHTVHDHELQRVIQLGRVGTALVDNGQYLGHVIFQIVGANGLLTGQHGIHVAADGIDLAVMQDKAVGVGTIPAGGRVGGEAAVHHADGGLVIRVLQIKIEQA